MSDNFIKTGLIRFLDDYTDQLLNEFKSLNIIQDVVKQDGISSDRYRLTSIAEKDILATSEVISKDSNVLQGYYDFRNTLSIIYRHLRPHRGIDTQKVDVSDMIDYFSKLNAFETSWQNISRLKDIMDKADNLFVDDDIKADAVLLFEKNKINFNILILELLEFYTSKKLNKYLSSYDFDEIKIANEKNTADFIFQSRSNDANDFLIEVKYRKRNFSIRELIVQAVNKLQKYNDRTLKKNTHIILILFNHDDENGAERNSYKFKQNLEENFSPFLNYIHFISTGINFIESFENSLSKIIDYTLTENAKNPSNLTLEHLFPGEWDSEFYLNGKSIEKGIQIRDGNKYFVDDVHWFDLRDVHIDLQAKKIKFKKEGLGNDHRQIFNDLDIIEIGEKYEGVEIDKNNKAIQIKYYKNNNIA